MSDGIDAGPAPGGDSPPAPVSAPIKEVDRAPNPVSTEGEPAPKEPEKKPEPTPRQAIERARQKQERDAKEADGKKAEPLKDGQADKKADDKAKDPQPRGEQGKFAPRETKEGDQNASQQPQDGSQPRQATQTAPDGSKAASDAPARFAADAKTEWASAPEPVRREVARMERELTAGLEKYKTDAEEFAKVREFHEHAVKNGGNLHTILTQVSQMEQALIQNPVRGLDMVCQRLGISLRDVAASLTGENANADARRLQQENGALQARLQQLEDTVRSFHQERQANETKALQTEIERFAASKPRFEELRPTMAGLMNSGMAADLSEAYEMADRLKPAPASASAPVPAPARDAGSRAPAAHTDAGRRSITGAPSPGSNPTARAPSSSIKESLRRAAAAAG